MKIKVCLCEETATKQSSLPPSFRASLRGTSFANDCFERGKQVSLRLCEESATKQSRNQKSLHIISYDLVRTRERKPGLLRKASQRQTGNKDGIGDWIATDFQKNPRKDKRGGKIGSELAEGNRKRLSSSLRGVCDEAIQESEEFPYHFV